VSEIHEPVLVQTFIAEVEALDERVLRGLAAIDEVQRHMVLIRPLIHDAAGELRSVVYLDRGRHRVMPGFFHAPVGMTVGEASGMALNSKEHIFLFQRAKPMLIEYDEHGTYVESPHLSFVAQGDYGVDAHGAASGDETGEERNSAEQDRYARKRERVSAGHAQQQTPQVARQCE